MGWIYTRREDGESVAAFFRRRFADGEERVLDVAVVKMRTAYMAYRDGDGRVSAVVCYLNYRPHDPLYNFGYKAVDEFAGGGRYDCPERILRLLTPLPESTPGEPEPEGIANARAWRAACWRRLQLRRLQPRVRHGDTIVFDEPITFSDGTELDTFRVVRGPRGGLRLYDGFILCRIKNWRSRPYSVRRPEVSS